MFVKFLQRVEMWHSQSESRAGTIGFKNANNHEHSVSYCLLQANKQHKQMKGANYTETIQIRLLVADFVAQLTLLASQTSG